MTATEAFLTFISGRRANRERAARWLAGSPRIVRLRYLGGHPGILERGTFWVGRMGDQLRLVEETGYAYYDVPLDRVDGCICLSDGRLLLRFEPTAGLMTMITLRGESPLEGYRDLRALLEG